MNQITITSLGTVSPYLKDQMNCPGYLIEYKNKKILLDCGNGITRILNFPNDLKDLSIIITHYHKDHFGDIGNVQYASHIYHNLGMIDKKIKIYLPEKDFGYNKKAIINNNESYSEYYDIDNNTIFKVDDLVISFEDNKSHSIESFMVKLKNKDFNIVYTSDVGITNFDELIKFCKDANILICESSLLKKYGSTIFTHLTAYDAALLAKKANCEKLILTHFWPEEDKYNYLLEAQQTFENVEILEEGKKLILKN